MSKLVEKGFHLTPFVHRFHRVMEHAIDGLEHSKSIVSRRRTCTTIGKCEIREQVALWPLIALLVEKRLALTSATSFDEHRHAAMIFHPKTYSPLSMGFNRWSSRMHTLHAEIHAFQKLAVRRRWKEINLLVIRTSLTQRLGNSRPCHHCIKYLAELAHRRKYRIHHVYFTTSEGDLRKERFVDMIQTLSEAHISSYYRQRYSPQTNPSTFM